MNIKFSYLYRDAGNYKNYNNIIFSNPINISVEQLENCIRNSLIEGLWFDAINWRLPDLHFEEYEWNTELDHNWHEFHLLKETTEDPTTETTIESFLKSIRK